jgi:elongation factor Ts
MAITASMVKDLRDKTGAGFMECKAALGESGGDMDAAVDILRKRGLKVAEKKAGRAAADGLVAVWISPDKRTGALVELNCETDFVARTEKFVALIKGLVELVGADAGAADPAALLQKSMGGVTVAEKIKELIGSLGENVILRRAARLAIPADAQGAVVSYLHGAGKIGVLVELRASSAEAAGSEALAQVARELALQVCSAEPAFVTREQVPAEALEHEREILRAQPDVQSKPAAIQDKIIQGRLEKYYAERCLLDQPFIRDPEGKQKVKDLLKGAEKTAGGSISVAAFARLRLGEGVEKKAAE